MFRGAGSCRQNIQAAASLNVSDDKREGFPNNHSSICRHCGQCIKQPLILLVRCAQDQARHFIFVVKFYCSRLHVLML